MKKTIVVVVATLLAATTTRALNVEKTDIPGQYDYTGGVFTNATMVLTTDRIVSKRAATVGAHPVAGMWKFKPGTQKITMQWADAVFTGITVSANFITGSYSRVHVAPVDATFTRTNIPIFHLIVNRLNTRAYGATIFNTWRLFPYGDYRIVVYSWVGAAGTIEYDPAKPYIPFKRLGFFKSKLHTYEKAEAYLISSTYSAPPAIVAPLTVDGTNVFAYDWQTNGFKWFDWSSTNDPTVL